MSPSSAPANDPSEEGASRSGETVRIEKVVAEGDGLGRLADGRVVFVEGALPGESVEISIVKQSRDYARATISRLVEGSPERVEPPCPHVARGCGGCDLQHASLSLQRSIKVDIVRESLQRLGRIPSPDVRSTWLDSRVGERSTMRVARAADGSIGFRMRRRHDVMSIDHCLVVRPELDVSFGSVRVPGDVEELTLRVSVASGVVGAWWEPSHSEVEGLGEHTVTGAGARLLETVHGRELQVSMASFFQSSPGAAEAIVDAVAAALGPVDAWRDGPFVDLYGGIGLFSATVAPRDRPVVVVEANPVACDDARRNLSDRSATVVSCRVEDWDPSPAAVVVADPARDGLRAAGVAAIERTGAELVALVSCDPASLGRDARLLVEAGFDLDWVEVLDPFPHTHHVEAVSRFVRREKI
jgi:23S rRNA (uracil1939-C5)-methyltransferase